MYSGTPAEEHILHCVVSSAVRGENRNQFEKGENLFFFSPFVVRIATLKAHMRSRHHLRKYV